MELRSWRDDAEAPSLQIGQGPSEGRLRATDAPETAGVPAQAAFKSRRAVSESAAEVTKIDRSATFGDRRLTLRRVK